MNYKKIYNDLINRGRHRVPLLDIYTESHHIVPKCMDGDNSIENLVNLTPEEHYLAHQLLVKIHSDNKSLIYALSAMCMSADSKNMIRNNKMYGWIKRKISESRKGIPRSEETKQKLKIANLGKKASEETRQKLRLKKGRKLCRKLRRAANNKVNIFYKRVISNKQSKMNH